MRFGLPEASAVCVVAAVFAAGYAAGHAAAPHDADALAVRRAAYAAAFPLGRSQGARSPRARAKRLLGARDGRKAARFELKLRAEEVAREATAEAIGLRRLPHAGSGGSGDDARWTSPEGCRVDWILNGASDVRSEIDGWNPRRVVTDATRHVALLVSLGTGQSGPGLQECRRILRARLVALPSSR